MKTNHTWKTGTSFDNLPDLSSNSVELILTDPPYDYGDSVKEKLHLEFERILKPGGTIIVFSPPENQWLLPASNLCFWIKPISTKNTSRNYSRFVEMIFIYRDGRETTWNCGRHWSQYTNVFMDLVDDANIHPYRKPPSLIERLMRNHSNPGDTVLDPFAGSGVVREIAQKLGLHSYSIEINPEYS